MNVNRRENKAVGHGRIGGRVFLWRCKPSRRWVYPLAEYIASMLEGLARVAGSAGMPFLAYLINVALEEAKVEKASRD